MISWWLVCGWGKIEEEGRGGYWGLGNGKEKDVEDIVFW